MWRRPAREDGVPAEEAERDPYASLLRGPSDVPVGTGDGTLMVLPGPTYGFLFRWAQRGRLSWSVPLIGFFLESKVSLPGWWTATMFALGLVLVLVVLYFGWTGVRVEVRELARGYTTLRGNAVRNPKLYLVHPVTKEIVSRPGEPRPKKFP